MNEKVNSILEGIYNAASILENLVGNDLFEFDRIILIGAHGTGKSTLANKLSEMIELPVVESVAREFNKDWKYMVDCGMFFSNMMTESSKRGVKQNILCSMSRWDFMRWVNTGIPVIMTRCPLDTLAYAKADTTIDHNIYKQNLEILSQSEEFKEALKHSLFIYLPIEFPIENDGERPMDDTFQKAVDQAMRELIYDFKITPLVVTGSVKERVEQVLVKLFDKDIAEEVMQAYTE